MARASLKTESKRKEEGGRRKEEEKTPKMGFSPSADPSPRASAPPELEPQPTEFVQEELPADFWDQEAVPVSAYDDETEKTPQTHAQPRGKAASPISHPLFAELQSLFPGKIVRFEAAKTSGKSMEDTAEAENGESSNGELPGDEIEN